MTVGWRSSVVFLITLVVLFPGSLSAGTDSGSNSTNGLTVAEPPAPVVVPELPKPPCEAVLHLSHSPALPLVAVPGWRILGRLGVGGFGEAWSAVQEGSVSNEPTAVIKIYLHPSQLWTHTVFDYETAALDQLGELLGSSWGPNPYIIIKYVPGQDFHVFLADRVRIEGQLSIKECIEWVIKILDAVAEIHNKGVTHRDLKPNNLRVQDTPNGKIIRAIDFGIAIRHAPKPGDTTAPNLDARLDGTVLERLSELRTGALDESQERLDSAPETVHSPSTGTRIFYSMGTNFFAAPEISPTLPFGGSNPSYGKFGPYTDIFSISRIAIHMIWRYWLHRTDPKILPDLREVFDLLTPQVRKALERAQTIDPSLRYQTAIEFKDALIEAAVQDGLFEKRAFDDGSAVTSIGPNLSKRRGPSRRLQLITMALFLGMSGSSRTYSMPLSQPPDPGIASESPPIKKPSAPPVLKPNPVPPPLEPKPAPALALPPPSPKLPESKSVPAPVVSTTASLPPPRVPDPVPIPAPASKPVPIPVPPPEPPLPPPPPPDPIAVWLTQHTSLKFAPNEVASIAKSLHEIPEESFDFFKALVLDDGEPVSLSARVTLEHARGTLDGKRYRTLGKNPYFQENPDSRLKRSQR